MSPLERRTPLQPGQGLRRTPLNRTRPRIRQLRADEPLPEVEPKRYHDGRGYIRLRWLVDVASYVEEYEHRVVMGRPAGEVHHLNGNKADNDPSNLVVLSKVEHAKLHEELAKASDPDRGTRNAQARKSARAEERRRERAERAKSMAADYDAGLTTVELGEKYSLDPSNVSRTLRTHGARLRPAPTAHGLRKSQAVVKQRAAMCCERCERLTTWIGGQVHHRLPRRMGGSSRPGINEPANLVLLCAACHAHVESHREDAYTAGWLVHDRDDPRLVGVELARGLTWLDDDGMYQSTPPSTTETGAP